MLACWNTCPDEEGTETEEEAEEACRHRLAGTRAPMKRGLKHNQLIELLLNGLGWNTCPDEEGTETYRCCSAIAKRSLSWNTCPDEEGTETGTLDDIASRMDAAGTRAPMKRGLKQINWDDAAQYLERLEHVPR